MNPLTKLKQVLIKENLDAFILHSTIMKTYLKLPQGSGIHVVISKDQNYLLYDGRYRNVMMQIDDTYRKIEYRQGSYYGDEIRNLNIEKAAVEANSFLAKDYLKLRATGIEIICKDSLFQELRIIKTSSEIGQIQKACELTDLIFEKLLTHIKVGMHEYELAAHLYYLVFASGASGMAFDPIIASKERGCLPHGRPSARVLQAGDLITIDFGIILNGYQSDMTRTVALGTIDDEMRNIYNIVKEAQDYGVQQIRAGIKASKVHQGVFDKIAAYGYGEYFTHGLGHGIGIGDDGPILNAMSDTILEEGMVMSCEPGIYIPQIGGVRIEDDVAIIDGKAKVLNKTTKELIVLEV